MPGDEQHVERIVAQSGAKVVVVNNLHGPLHAGSPASACPDYQLRKATLRRVRADWIHGVLYQSLYKVARLELDLTYNDEPIDLPLNVVVQVPDREPAAIKRGKPIIDVFEEFDGALLILGAPGTGKTTLLLELAEQLLHRATNDDSHPIPVVFNLSTWVLKRGPLEVWLISELNERTGVPLKDAQKWIENNQVLPLLDGLDEVDAVHRRACADAINTFRSERGLLPIAVCSRSTEFHDLNTKLRLRGCVEVQCLTTIQVHDYLSRSEKLRSLRLATNNDPSLSEMLHTPLMLWVAMLAYSEIPVIAPDNERSDQKSRLFASFVSAMLGRRVKDVRFSREVTIQRLSWLASVLTREKQTVLYIENLQTAWLPATSERWFCRACTLVGCAIACGFFSTLIGMIGGALGGRNFGHREALVFAMIGAMVGGLMGVVGEVQVEARPVEVVRFNWVEIRSRSRLALRSSSTIATIVTFGIWAAFSLLVGVSSGLIYGLLGGVSVGLIVALVTLLTAEQTVESRRIPNQGTLRSLKNAFLMFTIIGVIVGLRGGLSSGLSVGLFSGISLGLCAGMYGGGTFALKHFVLRLALWMKGAAPLNYVAFLNYSTERLLLHRVGSGYKFTHRMLQEYFASPRE